MTRPSLPLQIIAASIFWTFVTCLYVAQVWWLAHQGGESRPVPFAGYVWSSAFYLCWIPFTVVIWRVTAGWLPRDIGWPRFAGGHLGLAATAAVLHSVVVIALAIALVGGPREEFIQMLVGQVRSRSYSELIIYAGVVASGQALWLYDRWRERETAAARLEAELSTARLSALQSQIHPHFLFNSLHAIASLARDGRNADVVRTIADLSDLLRKTLVQGAPTLPLRHEVELAERYLAIQQVRFGERLRTDFAIDPAANDLLVPAFTLQPLVDNAVRHGISSTVRGGTVRVRASVDATHLTLIVEDDGSDRNAGGPPVNATGSGLSNLRSRLTILYGNRASLAAGPVDTGGFRVTVKVPRR